MSKALFSPMLILCCFAFANSYAQSNTVILKEGNSIISTHNSIQAAYDAIPPTIASPYKIEIDTGYNSADETFPIVFTERADASATNTIHLGLPDYGRKMVGRIAGNTDSSELLILDGADWVIIGDAPNGVVVFFGVGTTKAHAAIKFENGACNNLISTCTVMNTAVNPNQRVGDGVVFGESPQHAEGNSNNRIEYTSIVLSRGSGAVASKGSAANPNRNLSMVGNTLDGILYSFKADVGTGNTSLKNNRIANRSQRAEYTGAWFVDFRDSAIISGNQFIFSGGSPDSLLTGISFVAGTGATPYAQVINNSFLAMASLNVRIPRYISSGQAASIAAMEFGGAGAIHADVYHNTVRFSHPVAYHSSMAGRLQLSESAALKRTESNSNSVYNIKNNIFINTLTDGPPGAAYWNLIFNSAGTVNIDYNTYESVGADMIKWDNTAFSSLSAYQAAGHELNSDSTEIKYFGLNNFVFVAEMMNDTNLQGIVIPMVTDDIDGEARVYPYRGAHEFTVACDTLQPNMPYLGQIHTGACPGEPLFMTAGNNVQDGIVRQWQSRPAGSTLPFTDIPGAHNEHFGLPITPPLEIRYRDSCIAGGYVAYSIPRTVIFGDVKADSIAAGYSNYVHSFSVAGAVGIRNYLWDFGDGSGSSSASPTHQYQSTGTYNVSVRLENDTCSTVLRKQLIVHEAVSVDLQGGAEPVALFPNPATGRVSLYTNFGATKDVQVSVVSITGNVVYQQTSSARGKQQYEIDLSGQPKGIYIVKINSGNEQWVKRLVLR